MNDREKNFQEWVEKTNGLLGYTVDGTEGNTVINVIERFDGAFKTGQVVVFLSPITGLRIASPVTVETFDWFGKRLVVADKISVSEGTAIYISGTQDEANPPVVK